MLRSSSEMAPYYRLMTSVTPAHPLLLVPPTSTPDLDSAAAFQDLISKMEQSNKDELEKLDERSKDAEKTQRESEISDALKARANYLTRIGDRVSVCFAFVRGRDRTY